MKKIKEITLLIAIFSITSFIFGSIGVFSVAVISGKNITYDNSNSKLNSTNAQSAVDELSERISYGTATAGDILENKTALVNGSQVVGTLDDIAYWEPISGTSGEYTLKKDTDVIYFFVPRNDSETPITVYQNGTSLGNPKFTDYGTIGYAYNTSSSRWGVRMSAVTGNFKKNDVIKVVVSDYYSGLAY